jgi:hypothetical protein
MDNKFYSLLFLIFVQPVHCEFGHWSIDKELFLYIRSILPTGSTMVELGSGWTSGEFSKYYTVYSIEHNNRWIGVYNTNYIYAPIINSWYDTTAVQKFLPQHYDLILVDGPTGNIGRGGFLTNLHLFKTDVPIIFDDIDRAAEYTLMCQVAEKLQREYTILPSSDKKFGVILP